MNEKQVDKLLWELSCMSTNLHHLNATLAKGLDELTGQANALNIYMSRVEGTLSSQVNIWKAFLKEGE